MTAALLEAHRGFQQDQDREEANGAFLGLIDRGTKGGAVCLGRDTVHIKRRPRKDSRFLPLLPGSGPICALCLMISGRRRLNWREQSVWSDRRRCADRGVSCDRPKDAQFRATSGREPVMKEKLRFLGLDVHAETIAVAVAEPEGEVRSFGTIPNRAESIRKLIKKLGPAS